MSNPPTPSGGCPHAWKYYPDMRARECAECGRTEWMVMVDEEKRLAKLEVSYSW